MYICRYRPRSGVLGLRHLPILPPSPPCLFSETHRRRTWGGDVDTSAGTSSSKRLGVSVKGKKGPAGQKK